MSAQSRWAVEFWEELHKASCVHVSANTETRICTHTRIACPDDAPLHVQNLSVSGKQLHKHFRCDTWEVLFPVVLNHPSHKQPKSRTVSNFSQKQGYLAWLQLNKSKNNYTQTFKWMLWTWQTGGKAAYMHSYSTVV